MESAVLRKVVFPSPEGLHLRLASAVASLVKQKNAEVYIRKGDRVACAANVLEILTLCALQGDELVIEARGPDAEPIAAEVAWLFENGSDEPPSQPAVRKESENLAEQKKQSPNPSIPSP